MKRFFITLGLVFAIAAPAFAREESVLARVTVYWHTKGSKENIAVTGTRLRPGHCAVDPKKIPYGSKVLFSDGASTAVDTGPAVVRRTAAIRSAHTETQRKAIVVDRFFETKQQALAWAERNPHFMTLRVLPPEVRREKPASDLTAEPWRIAVPENGLVEGSQEAVIFDLPPGQS